MKNEKRSLIGILFLLLTFLLSSLSSFGDFKEKEPVIRITQSGVPLNEIGAWGYGPTDNAFVLNNRLYMGSGRMMDIFDVTNPAAPQKLGGIMLDSLVGRIFVQGNYAYVLEDGKRMQIIDISNPGSPVSVHVSTLPFNSFDIHVAGIYAYIAHQGGLSIYEVSDPASVSEVGFMSSEIEFRRLKVVGDYVYLTGYICELTIVNAANPANPFVAGCFSGSGMALNLDVADNYAYIVVDEMIVKILDVSVPNFPQEVGFFECPTWGIAVVGDYVYTAGGNALSVYNAANKFFPSFIDSIDIYGNTLSLETMADYAYVTTGYNGLYAVDISIPNSLSIVSRLDSASYTDSLYVSGSHAYAASGGAGLRVIDISVPSAPVEIGKYDSEESTFSIGEVHGNGSLVFALSWGRLRVLDVSDPAAPVEIGSWTNSYSMYALYASGNYVYVGGPGLGFSIIDITEPTTPTKTGNCKWDNAHPYEIRLSGDYAYLADSVRGVQVVDISNPAAPVLVNSISTGASTVSIDITGHYLFTAEGYGGLRIFDISDPLNPVLLGIYDEPDFTPTDVFAVGSYVFAARPTVGFSIIDAANPALPVEVGYYLPPLPRAASKSYVSGGYAYVAATLWGMYVVDAGNYVPGIAVTAPNGGESLEAGTDQAIEWTGPGVMEVKIEYSTDDGASWDTIAAAAPNTGAYNWTVPNEPAATCLIRVSDTAGPVTDSSDAVFTILEQSTITVTSPNGGENWEGTFDQTITWTDTGSIANVMLEYSTDSGGSWNTIAASTANTGSYPWTVPNDPSSSCLIRVSDTAGPASDSSDAVFTILEQRTITVTSPNGDENWEGASAQTITWSNTGSIANVMLEYSTDSGGSWNTIAASTTNTGSYPWTVPNDPSATCLIRVSDAAGPAADSSDAVFTILEQRTITVTSPNGDENWEGASAQTITWSNTGSIANVMLEYSTDSGGSWDTIAASAANTGSYPWTVPNDPSATCLIRVSDAAGPAADSSDAVFTILEQRTITVTSPNGGEVWVRRSTQAITWNTTGSIGDVRIQYSLNGGTDWILITDRTANSGSHQWTLPNVSQVYNNCLVKILECDGSEEDTSDNPFTISKR